MLAQILDAKRAEVATLRRRRRELRALAEDAHARTRGFAGVLRRASDVAVIAEFKRRSPSAGSIREDAEPSVVAAAYEAAGAAALSVLTDARFFGGSLADLERARAATTLPVLRKDFVLDEVQLWEAGAAGADAALLIVRALDDGALRDLLLCATAVGLDALVEAHDERELERALRAGATVVGANNRDLETFETDLAVSSRLAAEAPPEVVLVAESGIRSADDVSRLGEAGVDAVLVGEAVMASGGKLPGLVGVRRAGNGRGRGRTAGGQDAPGAAAGAGG
ncbi:MAG: indole-3-glycerol phosphate synthase TrpC [Longimicrobiales bacterium]